MLVVRTFVVRARRRRPPPSFRSATTASTPATATSSATRIATATELQVRHHHELGDHRDHRAHELGDHEVRDHRHHGSATSSATRIATATELQVRHHRELGDHRDHRARRARRPRGPRPPPPRAPRRARRPPPPRAATTADSARSPPPPRSATTTSSAPATTTSRSPQAGHHRVQHTPSRSPPRVVLLGDVADVQRGELGEATATSCSSATTHLVAAHRRVSCSGRRGRRPARRARRGHRHLVQLGDHAPRCSSPPRVVLLGDVADVQRGELGEATATTSRSPRAGHHLVQHTPSRSPPRVVLLGDVADVQRGELGDHRHPRAAHHGRLGEVTTTSRSPRAGHRRSCSTPRAAHRRVSCSIGDVADVQRGRARRPRAARRAPHLEPGIGAGLARHLVQLGDHLHPEPLTAACRAPPATPRAARRPRARRPRGPRAPPPRESRSSARWARSPPRAAHLEPGIGAGLARHLCSSARSPPPPPRSATTTSSAPAATSCSTPRAAHRRVSCSIGDVADVQRGRARRPRAARRAPHLEPGIGAGRHLVQHTPSRSPPRVVLLGDVADVPQLGARGDQHELGAARGPRPPPARAARRGHRRRRRAATTTSSAPTRSATTATSCSCGEVTTRRRDRRPARARRRQHGDHCTTSRSPPRVVLLGDVADVQRGRARRPRAARRAPHLEPGIGAGRHLVQHTPSRSPPRVVLLGDVADVPQARRARRPPRARAPTRSATTATSCSSARSPPRPLTCGRASAPAAHLVQHTPAAHRRVSCSIGDQHELGEPLTSSRASAPAGHLVQHTPSRSPPRVVLLGDVADVQRRSATTATSCSSATTTSSATTRSATTATSCSSARSPPPPPRSATSTSSATAHLEPGIGAGRHLVQHTPSRSPPRVVLLATCS